MLRRLVAEAQAGRVPQVRPTLDMEYNEGFLYLMATNALNAALEAGEVSQVSLYVEQVAGSSYRSKPMEKHLRELRSALQNRMEWYPEERAVLQPILELLSR